jgi:hypothetical protein
VCGRKEGAHRFIHSFHWMHVCVFVYRVCICVGVIPRLELWFGGAGSVKE